MQASNALNTKQAAERLGIDPRTVVRWVNAKKLKPLLKAPGYRGPYLFEAGEVERVAAELGEKAAS